MKHDDQEHDTKHRKGKEYRAGFADALDILLGKIEGQQPRAHRLSVQGLADAHSIAQAMKDEMTAQATDHKATAK